MRYHYEKRKFGSLIQSDPDLRIRWIFDRFSWKLMVSNENWIVERMQSAPGQLSPIPSVTVQVRARAVGRGWKPGAARELYNCRGAVGDWMTR